MNVVLDKKVAEVVAGVVKKNKKAARSLAAQYLAAVDKAAMANFLLGNGVAVQLLAERLMRAPKQVMHKLDGLAKAQSVWETPPGAVHVARATKSTGKGKRHRASAQETASAKAKIVAFVKKHPGATRKAIQGAVQLGTAFYNRVMRELKDERQLKQKGLRSKSTYYAK